MHAAQIFIHCLVTICFSLENIFTELAIDIKDFQHPGHGDLTGWAKQG